MCLAVPGKIIRKFKDTVTVDYGKQKRVARILEGDHATGDYVLVQAGFVVQKIPKKEALESLKAWNTVA